MVRKKKKKKKEKKKKERLLELRLSENVEDLYYKPVQVADICTAFTAGWLIVCSDEYSIAHCTSPVKSMS